VTGYYLQHPPIPRREPPTYEANSLELTEHVRLLSVPEKNKRAFAAADFALRQKRLLMAEAYPDWSTEQLEYEARRLVLGEIPAEE
jgi:hypothetical protein